MASLRDYLERAVADQASDLFIVAGCPVSEKLDGHLKHIGEQKLFPADTEALIREIYSVSNRSIDNYLKTGDDDFAFAVAGLSRFRVNAYRQRNSLAAVVRVVSFDIPKWDEINVPAAVMEVANISHGLVLFTGTAGSGKSTTQACIIDQINKTRDCHIVTLEDPIEYLHKNQRSIVSQREIAVDTTDYLSALRSCLRQAPDVILLGEMRDPETMRIAITAAETGHTVLATMHTKGTVNAIDRMIDTFAGTYQDQFRFQLATVLRTVVSQQMLPGVNGNVIPAFELMHVNGAIRNMIRDNKNHQIENAIMTGKNEGMFTMDSSILSLHRDGLITAETAVAYADHQEQMAKHIRG